MRFAGSHAVEFQAGDLPSGIYFYRLNAGQYSQTRKMMLVR
ncbi:MAG: T9SS type A sorting domain-containing protein [Calditrichaeota bacterium]|nr:T9SS type A sorting domain-containing protein [Calditrichota bacterium]